MISFLKNKKFIRIFGFSCGLLIFAFLISIAIGDISLSPLQLLESLLGRGTEMDHFVLFQIRLPRMLVTIFAGTGLAVSGAILQSLTRNPLSDPGIMGINAGAGLAVVGYVTFLQTDSTNFLYILPIFAFLGGIVTAFLILFISYSKGEGVLPNKLVLIGVGMEAAVSGLILIITSHFEREQYDFIANWLAGRIWGDDWTFVLTLSPWIIIFLLATLLKSSTLNALTMDEQVSTGLGVRVGKERAILMLFAVALASASVSVSGGIAFVGLLSPHIARSLVGPKHQLFLPITAIIGATLLLIADTIGRVILDPSGIPAGIIVTIIGAPYFLFLMIKKS